KGDGLFELNPVIDIEKQYLTQLTGKDKVSIEFQRAWLAFSDTTYDDVKKRAKQGALEADAAQLLEQFRKKIRKTTNDNVEADLLADIYNPKRAPSFSAYMSGANADDLRFFVKPQGAMPELSPEEVALALESREDSRAGILYLSHLESKWKAGT